MVAACRRAENVKSALYALACGSIGSNMTIATP